MLPTMVTITPRKMQIHEAQKCQLFILGFFKVNQMTEGSQKVVGPVPRAPIKPIKSAKHGWAAMKLWGEDVCLGICFAAFTHPSSCWGHVVSWGRYSWPVHVLICTCLLLLIPTCSLMMHLSTMTSRHAGQQWLTQSNSTYIVHQRPTSHQPWHTRQTKNMQWCQKQNCSRIGAHLQKRE